MKLLTTLSFCFLLLAGCSTKPQVDYSKADLVEVTGKVTLDGQPLAFAVVSFDSPDDQFSYAMTDEGGAYQLQFDSEQTGCTKGPKVVQISTNRKILGLNVADDGAGEEGEGSEEGANEGGRSSGPEQVPACYNKESKLKVTVTDSDTSFDFDLNSDGS